MVLLVAGPGEVAGSMLYGVQCSALTYRIYSILKCYRNTLVVLYV